MTIEVLENIKLLDNYSTDKGEGLCKITKKLYKYHYDIFIYNILCNIETI